MSKDLSKVREEGLDKFYTNPEIVDKCLESFNKHYDFDKFDLIIEPSAGSGNFYFKLPNEKTLGMDIQPDNKQIIKKNFFEYIPNQNNNQSVLVIGNPPFGRVSSLAIKFFNHASTFANVIAFIIPKTFRKVSVQNRLDLNFKLIYDEDIPMNPCSFTPKMMVKCCFQIWEKTSIKRIKIKLDTTHSDWQFLSFGPKDNNGQPTPPIGADFALRAYGGKCGEIIEKDLDKLRPKSWHWIKSNINKKLLISNFKKIDYSNSVNTARQNSIGRAELVELYKNI